MADEDKETGAEPEVLETSTDDIVVETEEQSPVEQLARDIGWTPKDQFKGDPDQWKPADEFIRTGRDVQRTLAKDVKALKSNIDNMARTNAAILQQQLADREAYWQGEYTSAIELGDRGAADNANRQAQLVQRQYAETTRPVVTNEAAEFAERNKGWFQKDPLATERAFAITETYARAGKSTHEQLEAAERQVRKEFPELFGSGKTAPSVNGSGNRTAGVSSRTKSFHDLPADAQKVAKDMVDRGVIPNTDSYVKNWFKQS